MCEKLKDEFKNKIFLFFSHIKKMSYDYIFVKDVLLEKAVVFGHVSKATYYRLLIPKLLSKSIDKVLYVDLDVIFMKKIDVFWEFYIEQYSHFGVINLGMDYDYKTKLGISNKSTYFNAGVMMINLSWWRDFKVYDKSFDFIIKHPDKIILWDQDVLNYVLESKWFELPFEYNAQEPIFRKDMFKLFNPRYFIDAFFNPIIIHYSGGGSSKPWYKECRHLLKNHYVYYSYLARDYQKNNLKWFHFFGFDLKLNFLTILLFHLQNIYRKLLYFLISKMKITIISKVLFK